MTDWLILAFALMVGVFHRGGLIIALWQSLNLLLWSWYELSGYWSALSDWAVYFYLKDFALVVLAGALRINLVVIIGLMSSVIFHIFTSWQINTYDWENVTLFKYRSDFMLYLSVIMLATVTSIGSGSNGGRRVRNPLLHWYDMRYSFLRYSGYKARS